MCVRAHVRVQFEDKQPEFFKKQDSTMLPNLAGLQLHDAEETAGRPRPLGEKDRHDVPIPPQGPGAAISKRTRARGPAAPAMTVADVREAERTKMLQRGIGVRLVRSNPNHRASMAVFCYTFKWDKFLQASARWISPALLLPQGPAIEGNRQIIPYNLFPGFFFFAEEADLVELGLDRATIARITVELRNSGGTGQIATNVIVSGADTDNPVYDSPDNQVNLPELHLAGSYQEMLMRQRGWSPAGIEALKVWRRAKHALNVVRGRDWFFNVFNRAVANMRRELLGAFRPWSEWVGLGVMPEASTFPFFAGIKVGPEFWDGSDQQSWALITAANLATRMVGPSNYNIVSFRSTTRKMEVALSFADEYQCCLSFFCLHKDTPVLPVLGFMQLGALRKFEGEDETIIAEGARYTKLAYTIAGNKLIVNETMDLNDPNYPSSATVLANFEAYRVIPGTKFAMLFRVDPP